MMCNGWENLDRDVQQKRLPSSSVIFDWSATTSHVIFCHFPKSSHSLFGYLLLELCFSQDLVDYVLLDWMIEAVIYGRMEMEIWYVHIGCSAQVVVMSERLTLYISTTKHLIFQVQVRYK